MSFLGGGNLAAPRYLGATEGTPEVRGYGAARTAILLCIPGPPPSEAESLTLAAKKTATYGQGVVTRGTTTGAPATTAIFGKALTGIKIFGTRNSSPLGGEKTSTRMSSRETASIGTVN